MNSAVGHDNIQNNVPFLQPLKIMEKIGEN